MLEERGSVAIWIEGSRVCGAVRGTADGDMLVLPVAALLSLLVEPPPRRSAPQGLSDRLYAPRLPEVDSAQHTSVVRLPGFASDAEIEALLAASATVQQTSGERLRSNGLKDGSWRTVFLNHHLQHLLPEFHAKLWAAAQWVDTQHGWGVLDNERRQVALRCAEHHTVLRSGGLPIERHYDHGSLITMDIMLSHTSEFEGGTFRTLEPSGELAAHPFERGDLNVFLSHKYHCVDPVAGGTRQVGRTAISPPREPRTTTFSLSHPAVGPILGRCSFASGGKGWSACATRGVRVRPIRTPTRPAPSRASPRIPGAMFEPHLSSLLCGCFRSLSVLSVPWGPCWCGLDSLYHRETTPGGETARSDYELPPEYR